MKRDFTIFFSQIMINIFWINWLRIFTIREKDGGRVISTLANRRVVHFLNNMSVAWWDRSFLPYGFFCGSSNTICNSELFFSKQKQQNSIWKISVDGKVWTPVIRNRLLQSENSKFYISLFATYVEILYNKIPFIE